MSNIFNIGITTEAIIDGYTTKWWMPDPATSLRMSREILESETPTKCSMGPACPIHHPKKPEPFIPRVTDWDLLPDV